MLQKSGYTDIKVAPTSFVVHAKDGDGNTVVMSISPDEFAEVTSVGNTTGSTTNNPTGNPGNTFVNVPENNDLPSSKLVGLDIYKAVAFDKLKWVNEPRPA
jgi:hypothetical protein